MSLSSTGSFRASSPASPVLSTRDDFLPLVSSHFVAFAWQYHGFTWLVRYPAGQVKPRRAWSWSPGTSGRDPPWKRQDLPRSWGTLLCFCPALRPRRDRWHLALVMPRCSPRSVHGEGSHHKTFEAQSHSVGTGCLRFAGRVTPPPRKTRFRLLARLYRTGLVTHRVPSKGFKLTSCSSSSFPKLSWRKDFLLFRVFVRY